MNRLLLIAILGIAALLPAAGSLSACPSCRDAVPSTSDADEDDAMRESRAYNNSIYLLAGMPYLLLGVVGFGVYRYSRKKSSRDNLTAAARP
jgi:hypothetical protein